MVHCKSNVGCTPFRHGEEGKMNGAERDCDTDINDENSERYIYRKMNIYMYKHIYMIRADAHFSGIT